MCLISLIIDCEFERFVRFWCRDAADTRYQTRVIRPHKDQQNVGHCPFGHPWQPRKPMRSLSIWPSYSVPCVPVAHDLTSIEL